MFPFSLNDVWNGVESNDKHAFKLEFEHRCKTLSQKEFKRWISNDYSFYSVHQLADPLRFNDLQNYIASSTSVSGRRQYADLLGTIIPHDEITRIFIKFPYLVDLYTDYLFNKHVESKQNVDDLICCLKCRLPFTYKRYKYVKLYAFREAMEKRKMSRLVTFGTDSYYKTKRLKTETLDLQKNYAKIEKDMYIHPNVKRMVGTLYKDCSLITDLIRICALYCPKIYLDVYGRKNT